MSGPTVLLPFQPATMTRPRHSRLSPTVGQASQRPVGAIVWRRTAAASARSGPQHQDPRLQRWVERPLPPVRLDQDRRTDPQEGQTSDHFKQVHPEFRWFIASPKREWRRMYSGSNLGMRVLWCTNCSARPAERPVARDVRLVPCWSNSMSLNARTGRPRTSLSSIEGVSQVDPAQATPVALGVVGVPTHARGDPPRVSLGVHRL